MWITLYTALCVFTIFWQQHLDNRRFPPVIIYPYVQSYNINDVLVWTQCRDEAGSLVCSQHTIEPNRRFAWEPR